MLTETGIDFGGHQLVSCVMVTCGRSHLMTPAIKSYLSQTYRFRELVIVSQASQEENVRIRNLIEPYPEIQFVEASSRLTLGEMRNLSIEVAKGDAICQWDDDDFYHPSRIMTQFKAMRGAVASLYTRYLKYFAQSKKLYLIDHMRGTSDYLNVITGQPHKKFLCGSVMFSKSCFYESGNRLYPERGDQSDREEDLNVLQKLMRLGKVMPVASGYQYCYVYHGTNTYEQEHHKMHFHKKHIGTAEELLFDRESIEETLQMLGEPADVCTSNLVNFDLPESRIEENVVFTYSPV